MRRWASPASGSPSASRPRWPSTPTWLEPLAVGRGVRPGTGDRQWRAQQRRSPRRAAPRLRYLGGIAALFSQSTLRADPSPAIVKRRHGFAPGA
jgi:hypothetical protein